MNTNIKPSDRNAIVAAINPQNAGAGSISTGWVSMADYLVMLAIVMIGVAGAGATVDVKLEQATDGAGAGAKDVIDKAITQLDETADNVQVLLNCYGEDLDIGNDFAYVRLTVTVAGGSVQIGGTLQGLEGRYQPVTQLATVVEVV